MLTEWIVDANYVRVNHDFFIQIREKTTLGNFENAYSEINYANIVKERSQDRSGSRVVVDLIRNARIHETLVLDRSHRMKHDVVYDTYDTWEIDCAFLRYLNTLVPETIIPLSKCR